MKYTTVITLVAIATGVTASPGLYKRESGLSCINGPCIDYYTTGSARCRTGYSHTKLFAKGDPEGSYCERACTADETKSCNQELCGSYKSQCRTYPEGAVCKSALERCRGAPVAMGKKICTDKIMEIPVEYDEAAGTCAANAIPASTFDKNSEDLVFSVEGRNNAVVIGTCYGLQNPNGKDFLGSITYTLLNCREQGPHAHLCAKRRGAKGVPVNNLFKVLDTKCRKAAPAEGWKEPFFLGSIGYVAP